MTEKLTKAQRVLLADYLGVTHYCILRWEKGERPVPKMAKRAVENHKDLPEWLKL